jgi:competence ComEA-like helix-hairpin-helix protein
MFPKVFSRCVIRGVLVIVPVLAMTIAVRSEQGTKPAVPAMSPAMSDEELGRVGDEMTEKICGTNCHTTERVYTKRRTARDWDDVMVAMATRGAPATDEQFAMIKRYLTRYSGIVGVNTAAAEELSAVMGFSAKDAKAIVEYRKTHGNFADIDALLKVEGIDKSLIEAQPDALVFK